MRPTCLLTNPWQMIEHYIDVVLGKTPAATLVREMAMGRLTSAQLYWVAQLAQAQLHRQRMFRQPRGSLSTRFHLTV